MIKSFTLLLAAGTLLVLSGCSRSIDQKEAGDLYKRALADYIVVNMQNQGTEDERTGTKGDVSAAIRRLAEIAKSSRITDCKSVKVPAPIKDSMSVSAASSCNLTYATAKDGRKSKSLLFVKDGGGSWSLVRTR